MGKLDVFYIEYEKSIKFFGNNGNTLEVEKNRKTYRPLKKLIRNPRFNFIDLLAFS